MDGGFITGSDFLMDGGVGGTMTGDLILNRDPRVSPAGTNARRGCPPTA
jgi:hypothetical protein